MGKDGANTFHFDLLESIDGVLSRSSFDPQNSEDTECLAENSRCTEQARASTAYRRRNQSILSTQEMLRMQLMTVAAAGRLRPDRVLSIEVVLSIDRVLRIDEVLRIGEVLRVDGVLRID